MTDETIRAAARALAGARQKTAGSLAALAEAQAVSDCLKARVTALETERDCIIANARGADPDPKNALRLCVLEADLKDMKPMTDDANAGVALAQSHDLEARQAVVRAEQQMAGAVDAEFEARLVEHAGKLEALLMTTLSEMHAAGKRIGRARPLWFPLAETATAIQKLHLMATQVRR